MKLYLHVGTEKTGSSFLQMMSAVNRESLLKSNIYFPKGGKREHDMLEGRISPGNGKELYNAIKSNSVNKIKHILSPALLEAQKLNCSTLLFSHENIIELFLLDGAVQLLETVCQELKITEINGLLILRDPVDQALSLYKHRAKSGSISNIDYWIKNEFNTLKVLDSFINHKEESAIQWTLKKYSKSSQLMYNYFFIDWLKVKYPIEFNDTIVNPSLTLSELLFLKNQKKVNPEIIPCYYKSLLKLDNDLKAKDDILENEYKNVIANSITQYRRTINTLNNFLDAKNQLQVRAVHNENISILSDNLTLSLSEYQIAQLLHTQIHFHTFKGYLARIASNFKKKVVLFLK